MIDDCCSDWSFEHVDFGFNIPDYNVKNKPFKNFLNDHELKEMFVAGKFDRDSFMWTTPKGDLVMVTNVNPLSGQVALPTKEPFVAEVGYTPYLGLSGNKDKVSLVAKDIRDNFYNNGKLVEHKCKRLDTKKIVRVPVPLLR